MMISVSLVITCLNLKFNDSFGKLSLSAQCDEQHSNRGVVHAVGREQIDNPVETSSSSSSITFISGVL